MILDQIQHIESYAGLHPRIARGLRYLSEFQSEAFVPGRKDIDGTAIFALLQEYASKPPSSGKWESHRRYADIQFIFKGEERMGYASCNSLSDTTPYNAQDDYTIHEGNGFYFDLKEGWFVIFFPQDAHMPGIAVDHPAQVQKIVLKIEL